MTQQRGSALGPSALGQQPYALLLGARGVCSSVCKGGMLLCAGGYASECRGGMLRHDRADSAHATEWERSHGLVTGLGQHPRAVPRGKDEVCSDKAGLIPQAVLTGLCLPDCMSVGRTASWAAWVPKLTHQCTHMLATVVSSRNILQPNDRP